ncbi:MAG: hypothetical protein K1X35_08100 [Caulobacteraceae bacterium]|nr:hypothetical protein [Caulobacteraceae bacterium]
MTDPIDPVRRSVASRPTRRRGEDRRREGQGDARPDMAFPVPAPERHDPEPTPPPSDSAFAAQVLGQGGQKKGLKGGPEVLNKARGAYLGAEYSGEADRRPPPGLIKKTEI